MTADHVNGLFEALGSIAIWLHVRRLRIDKQVRGASWGATAFFMAWGWWNLYYYPHLDQWWSFTGGLSIVVANMVWLVLMLYYLWKEENDAGKNPLGGPSSTLEDGVALYERAMRDVWEPLPDTTPVREPTVGLPIVCRCGEEGRCLTT